MNRNSLTLIFFSASALALGALFWIYGSTGEQGKVTISEATASPIQGNENAVVVELKLKNEGPPQTILNISSPDTDRAMIHGIEAAEALVIPADSTSSLSNDGAHLMLMGVEGGLTDGRLLTIKMELEPGGIVTTKARFSKQASSGHGGHQMQTENSGQAQHPASAQHGGMFMVPEGEPAPSIQLSAIPDTENVGWQIMANVTNFEFDKASVDGKHKPGTGHGHIYLNGMKLGRVFEADTHIGLLPKGKHLVRVTLNTNNHKTYMVAGKPVSDTIEIIVE